MDMKYSILPPQLNKRKAAWRDAVGMAANQWGINKRIFLFAPYGTNKNLEVIINPTYEPILNAIGQSKTRDYEWEGCFSLPLIVGYVERYVSIKATYQNEQGQVIIKHLSGYPARVWQHETDHLNGILYDDARPHKCFKKKVFASQASAESFYDRQEKERGRGKLRGLMVRKSD